MNPRFASTPRPGIRLVLLLLAWAGGCGGGPSEPVRPDGGPGRDGGCVSTEPTCEGDEALECRDGEVVRQTCEGICVDGIGCAVCEPGRGSCDGDTPRVCRADGTGWDEAAACDPAAGSVCDPLFGRCVDLCEDAAETRSYRGCEYWPVTTINALLDREVFAFAVVVANPQEHPVTVTITRGTETIDEQVIDPGDSRAIELPWVEALQSPDATAKVVSGAYRMRSSLPVTAYQYSPLQYQSGEDYSYSNDASLLLPTTALGTHYVVVTRPSGASAVFDTVESSPGFVAIVATEDGTEVDVTSSAHVLASTSRDLEALEPGGTTRVTLARGEVLQLLSGRPDVCDDRTEEGWCNVARPYDLTGTEIRASRPVEAIAGHSCAFVAWDRPSCDHLEESLFPVEAWGDSALVVPTQPFREEPQVVRIVSATDDNVLAFDPPGAHPAVTLDRGEILELETRTAFQVTGSDAIEVAQLMVGQSYAFPGDGGQGDPSMSIVVPTEQFRSEYQVLTPGTYASDVINVIAPAGASVMVDGLRVGGFVPIGGTGFSFARVPLIQAGAHRVTGDVPFGVVAYGFAEFTSYMMPGGLDLTEINPPI